MFEVTASETLEGALESADFVVISIEPGPVTMRYADLEIPGEYGIIQPVGDTTGPGGVLRALRAVPVYEEFAHRIVAACPKAWVINYTNPMTLCTAALYAAEPGIKAFGCCHEVFNTQEILAKWAGEWFETEVPDRREIRLDLAGVNHFTFATSAFWDGRALLPLVREKAVQADFFADRTDTALDRKAREKWFDHDTLIACDFLLRFGALGAAGDRHLTEFVPWYLSGEEELHRWGVVLTPYSWRVEQMKKFSRREPDAPLEPSGEEGVDQMKALLGIDPLITNVNIPNRGQLQGLPAGAVVETYAHFSRDEIRPIVSSPLPPALESMTLRISQTQSMILQAALRRDRDMAFQALLCDPLVRIPTDKAWKMFLEMLEYARGYLPVLS